MLMVGGGGGKRGGGLSAVAGKRTQRNRTESLGGEKSEGIGRKFIQQVMFSGEGKYSRKGKGGGGKKSKGLWGNFEKRERKRPQSGTACGRTGLSALTRKKRRGGKGGQAGAIKKGAYVV